jgi:hypothetical protein
MVSPIVFRFFRFYIKLSGSWKVIQPHRHRRSGPSVPVALYTVYGREVAAVTAVGIEWDQGDAGEYLGRCAAENSCNGAETSMGRVAACRIGHDWRINR